MSILVLLLFFALIGTMIYGDSQSRFISLIAGTVLFPTTALFVKNPSISPQHILLYAFLLIEFFQDRENFFKSIFKNPLIIPLTLILGSYSATSLFNSGLASKEMYYGIRDFLDTFGYILAAYIAGKKLDINEFAHKLIPFIVICCLFGILEGLINANYPYKFINSAFPIYEGMYDLNGSVGLGQDWRTRTCFTTKHPTAFGTLITSLFLFYLPYFKKERIPQSKVVLVLVLLGMNAVICGSRTCLFCVVVGAALYIVDKFSIIAKIAVTGIFIFSLSTLLAIAVENVGASGQGRGSSLDFRAQQLAFSFMAIQNSPIIGNGNKFTANTILEEGDRGKRAQDSSGQDMGGLESIVFTLLIDRGFVGLGSYYLFLLWMFFILFRNRSKFEEINGGFTLIIAGSVFLTLSGTIGNSSSFLFLFAGIQLGYIRQKQEELQEIESREDLDRFQQKISESQKLIESDS